MSESADLVVVGAGTVGGWASVFAREDGAGRVVVVDAATAGQGASSRAAGMVRTQGGTPTAVDLGRWTVGFYLGQHERYGIDSDFRALGYLIVATSEDDVRAAQLRLAMQRQRGLDARWVTPAQAAELLPLLDPQRILGATFCEQDGAISPPRNVAAYLVMMREHGVRLRERAPVVRLRLQGGRVTGVETRDGVIAAERVILAGGVGQGALGALAGRRAAGGRRAPPRLRHQPGARARRRPAADGLRRRGRAVLAPGGGRPALRDQRSGRGARRGARDRRGHPARGARASGPRCCR